MRLEIESGPDQFDLGDALSPPPSSLAYSEGMILRFYIMGFGPIHVRIIQQRGIPDPTDQHYTFAGNIVSKDYQDIFILGEPQDKGLISFHATYNPFTKHGTCSVVDWQYVLDHRDQFRLDS